MIHRFLKTILFLAVLVLGITFALMWWEAPPHIDIPIAGKYISSSAHVSCAAVACHYFREYETTVNEKEAYTTLLEYGWTCRKVTPDVVRDRYRLKTSYYECEHGASPRGTAFIAIDPIPRSQTGVTLVVYMLW